MRIHYMSDLHLEFGGRRGEEIALPETDVLVLAGDITLARCLDPARAGESLRETHVRDRTLRFFDQAREKAGLGVIYISGNHEPYGYDLDASHEIIRKTIVGGGVRHLENQVVELGGVALLCCTLWTDMDRRNPLAMIDVGRGMSDFQLITKDGVAFRPDDAADLHDASVAWLRAELDKREGQTCVVVTHHAPSQRCVHKAFAGNPLNPGFVSDLDDLIATHDIHAWIFGHTHVRMAVEIEGTHVVSNAAGFPGTERRFWDADKFLEL